MAGTYAHDSEIAAPRACAFVALSLVLLLLAFAYCQYALEGWFFLDDFGFIAKHHSSVHLEELFHPIGFGRFLSTNLYWNLTWRIFGGAASLYFALNLFFVGATSWLLGLLVGSRYGRSAAVTAGLCYAALPFVIDTYSWISNSQHLLAHLFCALFLYLYFRWERRCLGVTQMVVLESILVAALLCNQLSSALLVVPLVDLAVNRDRIGVRRRLVFLGIMAITVCMFAWRTRGVNTGPYTVEVNTTTLFANTDFYFGERWVMWLWFVTSVAGFAYVAWRRRDALHATMWLGGVAFLVPFLFLKYQRYPQYVALAMTMFVVALWISIHQVTTWKAPKLVPIAVMVSTLALGAWGLSEFGVILENPVGARQHRYVVEMSEINEIDGPDVFRYCFDSDEVVTGVEPDAKSMPYEWYGLGSGVAFQYFVDTSKTYEPASTATECSRTIRFRGPTLTGERP